MTVGEIIEILEQYSDGYNVFIQSSKDGIMHYDFVIEEGACEELLLLIPSQEMELE